MTEPLIDVQAPLTSLSAALLVLPATLALIVLRAFLLWRLDRRSDDDWQSRRAA